MGGPKVRGRCFIKTGVHLTRVTQTTGGRKEWCKIAEVGKTKTSGERADGSARVATYPSIPSVATPLRPSCITGHPPTKLSSGVALGLRTNPDPCPTQWSPHSMRPEIDLIRRKTVTVDQRCAPCAPTGGSLGSLCPCKSQWWGANPNPGPKECSERSRAQRLRRVFITCGESSVESTCLPFTATHAGEGWSTSRRHWPASKRRSGCKKYGCRMSSGSRRWKGVKNKIR